jgi:hypothetical protein
MTTRANGGNGSNPEVSERAKIKRLTMKKRKREYLAGKAA